jgi:hypothetical protein
MALARILGSSPLPLEFLEWQVRLRAWTAEQRAGAPHVGVAPLLAVRQPRLGPGVAVHPIICGLLPHARMLVEKTCEFRAMYEGSADEGARVIYDRGLEYLKTYYRSPEDFDSTSVTTFLPRDAAAVRALAADPTCALVFYVFELDERPDLERFRSLQINCRAEILAAGPVYENVRWHYALFHGLVDGWVVVQFRHEDSFDTRFGVLEPIGG